MGKNAQKRRGDTQPNIDHFILGIDPYVSIRRYLGSRPHDETRELITALEGLPVVTEPDMALRVKQAERLAELETPASDVESTALDELKRMASAGEPLIGKQPTRPHGTVVGDILDDGAVVGDDPVDKQPEEGE